MRRAILSLLAAAAVCGAVRAGDAVHEKGTAVHFSQPVVWRVSGNALIYRDVPYRFLDCGSTQSCTLTLPSCHPVILGKQTAAKTSIWVFGGRWVIKGDMRPSTFATQSGCLAATVPGYSPSVAP